MDGFDKVIDLIGSLNEVVVILKANNDTILFSNLYAGLNIVQHPIRYLFLCVPLRFWSACKNPDDRGTHLGGRFDPVLNKVHLPLAFAFIRDGKIIPDARTTDLQTETEGFSLYMKKI